MHSSSTKSKLITDDIIIIILKYLPPNDLLRAIESSKSWFSAASKDSNRIWRIHAENIWKQSGMTVNVPSGDLSLLARIKRIPLPTLKRSLQRVDITRCVEKIDFQRMLMANLLFGGRSSESCAKLRIYYPDWALKVDEYKAAYFHGKHDVKRTQIHMSELCAIGWIFYFKTEFGYDEEVSSSPSKFRNDFTYYSERFGQTYYWQFRTDSGGDRRIQVDQYPPLRSSRMPDGRWKLENQFVYLLQQMSLPGEDLPLIDTTG